MTRAFLALALLGALAASLWLLWSPSAAPDDGAGPSGGGRGVVQPDRDVPTPLSEEASTPALPSALPATPDIAEPRRLTPEGIEVGVPPPSLEALVPTAEDLPGHLSPVRGMNLPLLLEGGQARDLAGFYLGGLGCPAPPHEARRVAMGVYLQDRDRMHEVGVLACEFADAASAYAVAVELRQSTCRSGGIEAGDERLFLAGAMVVLTWRDGEATPAAHEVLVAHVRKVLGLGD